MTASGGRLSVAVEGAPGTGHLVFRRVGPRTCLERARFHSPARVLTPGNHGHAAWAYVTTLGGGLVDGDAVSLHIEVAPAATAYVSTQGATRVFRGAQGCTSDIHAQVAEGGLLFYLPEPLTLFEQARLTQRIDLELAAGASAVWLDVLSAGRVARGERWAFSALRSTLRVHVNGRLLVEECTQLAAAPHAALAERMGRFDAYATLLVLGPRVAELAAALQTRIAAERMIRKAALVASVSTLPGGVLLRAAAISTERLLTSLHRAIGPLGSLLGDDPLARRS